MDVIKELYSESAADGIQTAKGLVDIQAKIISAKNDLEAVCQGKDRDVIHAVQPAHAALMSAEEAIGAAISEIIDGAMRV